MRSYSASVLLLGATMTQHAEHVVASAVSITYSGLDPTLAETAFVLIPYRENPRETIRISFSGNASFRLNDVSLFRWQSRESHSKISSFLSEKSEVKLDVTDDLGQVAPWKDLEGNKNISVTLDSSTVRRLAAGKFHKTSSATLSPVQVSSTAGDDMPSILYLQVKYRPLETSPGGIARQQQGSHGNSGSADTASSTVNSQYFGLTALDRSDPQFNQVVVEINEMLRTNSLFPSPDVPSGDGTEETKPPGTTPTILPGSETPSSDHPSSRPSPGGVLSTSEIAGIAVGAGLGFLIIAGSLAFCLLRWRRRNAEATRVHGYSVGGRSGDAIAEKEAANTAVSESGAHSPYSDDGRPRFQRDVNVALTGPGAGAEAATGTAGLMAAHHQHEESIGSDYVPYSDRPSNVSSADDAVGSASAIGTTTSTPVGQPTSTAPGPIGAVSIEDERVPVLPRSDTAMSGTYAHLVEDGMTAAEIARLEDEERQLDQAIERARGMTTK